MKKLAILIAIIGMTCAQSLYAAKVDQLKWVDMSTMPLHGTAAPDASKAYSRLPDALKDSIRPDLWALGQNSAGLYIRFASDASNIGAKWRSLNKFNMNHMTAAGIRGLDLYTIGDDGRWTTVSSARPRFNDHNTTTMVIADMEPRMREYMLYLPLYDGVDSIYIGVDSTATIVAPRVDSPRSGRPIVMYGTSILQGGCASRPGMVHTSILSRMLDREVYNLGFSGNARLDPEIAQLIADIPDPSVIVLDPLPNLKTPELIERMPGFIATIRKAHPSTPIVLVESPIFPVMRFSTETLATITEKNAALKNIYNDLHVADSNLYYFAGEDVLGDCWEGTVDNYHFTDLGFTTFANNLYPLLNSLLK